MGVYQKYVNLANLLANVLIAIVSWEKKMYAVAGLAIL